MSKMATVFPGQGSQSVGMLAALAEAWPQVQETFAEASEVLGEDLWALVQQGPAEALNRTDRTQPAMLAAGVAVWRVWQAAGGPMPVAMAGHSLGEYSALVAADTLPFADAVKVVEARARAMQEAVPEGTGAMAAILGLDDDQVRALCEAEAQGQVLEPVNFNSPGQVVIAGHAEAVARATAAAKAAGARRALVLPVSVPSHCTLMAPAAERLAEVLAGVKIIKPRIPVLHNVDVATHDDPDGIREALRLQLHSPVRWVETIRALAAGGASTVIELGPGKVLTGLNKRIDRQLQALAVEDPDSLAAALQAD
ncbi:ACP S-malonyltransferase [Thiohalobacter sp.]|uniref:ACP S-malonyltransferase n=1 Tax=Thiohalobacter sp. TaxID=2025948 RepID=UPI0026385D4A|nr:ACP S-malonyltransferase [Thiohalobacter sp.]